MSTSEGPPIIHYGGIQFQGDREFARGWLECLKVAAMLWPDGNTVGKITAHADELYEAWLFRQGLQSGRYP